MVLHRLYNVLLTGSTVSTYRKLDDDVEATFMSEKYTFPVQL